MLGLLVLAGGQPLSQAELIAALWDEYAPTTAANIVQRHVMYLRRLLEPARPAGTASVVLPAASTGYALRLPPGHDDLDRFRQLVGSAARGGPAERADLLGQAVRLWQGSPLAGLAMLAGHPKVVRLAAERQAALVGYGQATIALGRAAEAVPIIEEAAASDPLDETIHALLVRALDKAGRRAHAFAAYQAIREQLAGELGVGPGPELTAAHAALLCEQQAAGPPIVVTPAIFTASPVPAQLPPSNASFAGREDALRELDAMLTPPTASSGAIVLVVLSGTAGVGKTTLAVHWGRRVAGRFPAGQLYVDLRGFARDGAMEVGEALRGFLVALGVEPCRIPSGVAAQVSLYRSLLAERRMLLVLDNARDAEQVRPLLPVAAGSVAVVTSRNRLMGLLAADGARPLTLEPLSVQEARELLAVRIGRQRIDAEPAAVDEIVRACARLPLALAVVSARAAGNPAFRLAGLALELRAATGGLDGFDYGEATDVTDARTAFSWSRRAISADADRLFRLLGLVAGPELSVGAAAALAAAPTAAARSALAELARAHLVTEPSPGRYGMHDLLRAYAAEQLTLLDRTALRRLLDHYVHTASAASILMDPLRVPVELVPADQDAAPWPLADADDAHAWFVAEHASLLAAVAHAARAGLDAHCWQLAWALATFLFRDGRWHEMIDTQRSALAAAIRTGDRAAQACAHRYLGSIHSQLGLYDESHQHLDAAARAYRELGMPVHLAWALADLSGTLERQGQVEESLRVAGEALEIFSDTGHLGGRASVLGAIGASHASLRAFDQTIRHCHEALDLATQLGDVYGQAVNHHNIGHAHHHLDDLPRAAEHLEQARILFERSSDRIYLANTLGELGAVHSKAGRTAQACHAWQHACDILTALNHPGATDYRNRLAATAN